MHAVVNKLVQITNKIMNIIMTTYDNFLSELDNSRPVFQSRNLGILARLVPRFRDWKCSRNPGIPDPGNAILSRAFPSPVTRGVTFSQKVGVPLPLPFPPFPYLPSHLEVGSLIELGGLYECCKLPSGV